MSDISEDSVADAMGDILIQYLSDHETDIAAGINDYGNLYPVFEALVGKKPRGNPSVTPLAHAINKVRQYPH